jgi:hypothetical protein
MVFLKIAKSISDFFFLEHCRLARYFELMPPHIILENRIAPAMSKGERPLSFIHCLFPIGLVRRPACEGVCVEELDILASALCGTLVAALVAAGRMERRDFAVT